MPKPWKNPRSEFLYFRKKVPEVLRPQLGGAYEIRQSLKTADPVIAKALNDAKHAEYDRRWARLRAETISLDHPATEALAGEFYKALVNRHRGEPGSANSWRMRFIWDRLHHCYMPRRHMAKPLATLPNRRLRMEVRTFLIEKGWKLDPDSEARFVHAASRVSVAADDRLYKVASFDFSGDESPPIDENVARFPVADPKRGPDCHYEILFERFADEARYPERTRKSWKSRVVRFMTFCGREFPADVTRQDVQRFKTLLIEQKLDRTSTIRNGYFAALRSFLKWCTSWELGPEVDPLHAVKVYPDRDKSKVRHAKGYGDEEAALILATALRPMPRKMPPVSAAARRWIPWICATTGARVTEVAQLRKQDVTLSTFSRKYPTRIPIIRFLLDAGPQKVFERDVPVHPDLVALGFLDFVEKAPGERLFVDPSKARTRGDLAGLTASAGKGVARWVGGMIDRNRAVQPNHAWRHRFKNLSDEALINPEYRDSITGHVPASVGAEYGNVAPSVKLHWMSKMESHLDLVRELHPDLAPSLPPPELVAKVAEGMGIEPSLRTSPILRMGHRSGTPEFVEDGIFFEISKT